MHESSSPSAQQALRTLTRAASCDPSAIESIKLAEMQALLKLQQDDMDEEQLQAVVELYHNDGHLGDGAELDSEELLTMLSAYTQVG
jgi:hypothetical protein